MDRTDVGTMRVPVFGEEDLNKLDMDTSHPWYFTAAMVSTCHPLFGESMDNYDVERELLLHKVIRKGNECDSESCQMFVNFTTKAVGMNFVKRLNAYLVKKAKGIQGIR